MSAPLGGSSLSSDPDRASGQAGPGVVHALGLILLYFILQLGAGTLLSLVLGAIDVIQHPGEKATAAPRACHEHFAPAGRQYSADAHRAAINRNRAALSDPSYLAESVGNRCTAGLWASPCFVAELVCHGDPGRSDHATAWRRADRTARARRKGVAKTWWNWAAPRPASFRLPLALIAVVVGPLVEELLFRGVLLSALLRRLSTGWAVLLCSVLFGAVHLEGLSYSWYALPNLMLLAIALCWLRPALAFVNGRPCWRMRSTTCSRLSRCLPRWPCSTLKQVTRPGVSARSSRVAASARFRIKAAPSRPNSCLPGVR